MAEDWIAELSRIRSREEQAAYLRARPELQSAQIVDELQLAVVNRATADLDGAEALANAVQTLAELLGDPHSKAVAVRASGHIHYSRAEYSKAFDAYAAAIAEFDRLGCKRDAARARSGAIQTLIYLGMYDQALEWAASAREVLLEEGDLLRAARCDLNAGNLHYRQDRYAQALAMYRRAQRQFVEIGTPRDVVAALSNIAVCLISLQDYDGAMAAYAEGRRLCVDQEMWLWAAEADYNIAYLHFLRGEYTRAMQLYQSARTHCKQVGDHYHTALCDLDQAEMFLELNLLQEGAQLARLAHDAFASLGMGYEGAKALTFLALAAGRRGESSQALRMFASARNAFIVERNETWPAYIDLYRALVSLEEGRIQSATVQARRALAFFRAQSLSHKTSICLLVLAKAALLGGRPGEGLRICRELIAALPLDHPATIRFQAHFLRGRIEIALGDALSARQSFETAIDVLESLRSRLAGDDLKTAFFKDKLTVYEHYLTLMASENAVQPTVLLQWMERAKCRGLAELLRFQEQSSGVEVSAETDVAKLRQTLNACYRQFELAPLGRTRASSAQRAATWAKIRECEGLLAGRIAESQAVMGDYATLHDANPVSLERIREQLPKDAVMVEYFLARDRLLICVVDHDRTHSVEHRVGERLASQMRFLRFQLSKFRLGSSYITRFSGKLMGGALSHLRELYEMLIAPIRPLLVSKHLVIVPHGPLHHLPFSALYDGARFLIDDFTISFAPSATVYTLCAARPPSQHTQTLAIGVPDASTPFVEDEIRSVASSFPNTRVLLGSQATLQALRDEGANCRILHIASHGQFRQDNPMFSSVQLGDSRLNLYDLYDLKLTADLVTLSGCSTGLSTITGGDELVGLVRGVLYAGASSMMSSLWEVHDRTAAELVAAFYRSRREMKNQAEALRRAMLEVRTNHPHPYFWAPFLISGKFLT